MRKEFAATIEAFGKTNDRFVFITGDLGFMALENVRAAMGERFINAGVSEQNMVSMAAAMSTEGLTALCYSIAPFAVFRPAEQIRLDVCLHNLNVKIVGNGGGYGYGIMGATHHAIEDIAFLSSLQHMQCYIPFCNEDVAGAVSAMMNQHGPSYLRLGFGNLPAGTTLPSFADIRQLQKGNDLTIVAMGPVGLNALETLSSLKENLSADFFAVSQMPLLKIDHALSSSIAKTKKVLVIEEHVKMGGLGSHLANLLLDSGISVASFKHLHAQGYPNGLYGSQKYHQKICGLDSASIKDAILSLCGK